jgi:3-methyladenine DNA glycosylase/8-oxoguanine DNA glycosylase
MERNVIPPYASDAVAHLKRVDPILGDVIDRVGSYAITRRPERFHSLVRAIIFQQLAGRAAQTIFDRFVKAVGGKRFPTPALLLAASDEVLRSAGLSRGKMSYIRDLATHVNNRALNFHRHARMTDDEIIADLTRVRGIGRWTAEMFLMFNLHRPDVLPVDDLGVRNAVGRLYKMIPAPTAKELREFGERWRPYRSVASWYLWRSYDLITPETSAAAATGAAKKVTAKRPTTKPIARKASGTKTNACKSTSIKTGRAKTVRPTPAKSVAARNRRAVIKKS